MLNALRKLSSDGRGCRFCPNGLAGGCHTFVAVDRVVPFLFVRLAPCCDACAVNRHGIPWWDEGAIRKMVRGAMGSADPSWWYQIIITAVENDYALQISTRPSLKKTIVIFYFFVSFLAACATSRIISRPPP